MKNKLFPRLIAGFAPAIFAAACLASAEKPPLTLESIFSGSDFQSQHLENVQWAADGSRFLHVGRDPQTGHRAIFEHDTATGEERLRLSSTALAHDGQPVTMSGFTWPEGSRYVLINGPQTRTWDSVMEGPHFIYDLREKTLTPLAGANQSLRNVKLSPDGRHAGYVRDNNLYLVDLETGRTRAVTTDGSADIFNAIFDYGSTEFGFVEAWHWSPDSQKVAFWRLDATDVKVFWIIDELGKYSEVHPLKYPNTAEKHAVNQIGVYDLPSGKTLWMDTGDDPDAYIPRIDWTPSAKTLAIQRLTRDHDTLDLLLADTETGRSRVVVSDNDPAWVDITTDLMFLDKQRGFVWTSEKSGYRHAYLYDFNGAEKQLTNGDWEISSLIALDEQAGWLYFYAKKDGFTDQHVYRVGLDGSDLQKLSDRPGWYEWALSPAGDYAIETWSDVRTPPRITLRKPGGEQIRILLENRLEGLAKFAVPNPEFLTFETSDRIELNAYMIKPDDFDPERRYPVIGYGYGNAGSQMVVNRWGSSRGAQRDLWHRYMATQGYVIFTMDNRTTAGRGKKAKNLTYGHYAKWAVHDQLEGAAFLKTLPYIDPERLGFWGWSGGGYLAAALMTKGAPTWKTGVSVAPVIDLTRYQAVGVERWMDQLEVNPEGYYQVNLMNFADQLQGDLLLIHGTGDENVKFAFTLQFADSLIKAGKQFDMMVYPNEHHGIEGARQHVYTKIADYFKEKL